MTQWYKTVTGWSNPNRPLYTLPSCSFTNVYSTLDELVCPYGFTGSVSGVVYDTASTLDKYMTTGDIGTYYSFTGAQKTKTVSEVSYASDANIGIPTVSTAVYVATVSPTSNNYLRIPVNLNNPATIALSDHGNFTVYFYTVVDSVLGTLNNAN